ncbi:hypothetical protein [Fundidesulfovibrio terrae]|uniref:hypothetical protein n=1 Tax=Fundidesulfovibrio terrae TaxID=2922866 RepID=UPI001FAFE1A5|nr:hypothetical protein [Fundidesulfovibrio terrae]
MKRNTFGIENDHLICLEAQEHRPTDEVLKFSLPADFSRSLLVVFEKNGFRRLRIKGAKPGCPGSNQMDSGIQAVLQGKAVLGGGNLYEVRGKYPNNLSWKIFTTADSVQGLWETFEADGIFSSRLIGTRSGSDVLWRQNNGLPPLFMGKATLSNNSLYEVRGLNLDGWAWRVYTTAESPRVLWDMAEFGLVSSVRILASDEGADLVKYQRWGKLPCFFGGGGCDE